MHEVETAFSDFFQSAICDSVEFVIFADRGKERRVLALHLDAQKINDVRIPFHRFCEVGEADDALRSVFRKEGARAEKSDLDTEFFQDAGCGARDPGVKDISDDEDFLSSWVGKFFLDRKRV